MTTAHELFNPKLNKPESKYGSTRSTLFGKFYERIISTWLERKAGYVLERWKNGSVRKPRIYWNTIPLNAFDLSGEENLEARVKRLLLSKKSHCTPDGLFTKNGKFYIWEAKNWPLYPENGPESQIWNYLSDHPWIFAKLFDLGGNKENISGFLFSFWYMDSSTKESIENRVNKIVGKNMFKIILNTEIIDDCIQHQYPWYVQIIEQERQNVISFFDQLLGRA